MIRPKASPNIKAVRAVRRWLENLHQAVNETGLLPGHRDYVRFVIVTSARTGSNLLAHSIGRDDTVVVYSEILRRQDIFPPRFARLGNSSRIFRDDPVRFLERYIYRKYPRKVLAVGFKLFYYHAPRDSEWGRAVWRYLAGDTGLRVIHLRRRNLLAAQISLRKADETNQWIRYSDPAQQSAMPLDFEETRASFEQQRAWERDAAERFAGHPLLEVFYEDLAADFSGELHRVQTFLELRVRNLSPATSKRPSQPLAEQIVNYHELKAQFAGTPWAEFFNE